MRITDQPSIETPNPRHFRTLVEEPGRFGPLTKEQEGGISDMTDPFSLILVLGSSAMGLRDVASHVRKIMRDLEYVEGRPAHDLVWEEIPVRSEVLKAERSARMLRDYMRPRNRNTGMRLLISRSSCSKTIWGNSLTH